MAVAEQKSESILARVAQHEQDLLAQVEASIVEARDIVERGRSEARRHLQAEEERLAEDVSTIRREAGEARERAFAETVSAAEARLTGVRAKADRRSAEVAKRVLDLLLPSGGGGGSR